MEIQNPRNRLLGTSGARDSAIFGDSHNEIRAWAVEVDWVFFLPMRGWIASFGDIQQTNVLLQPKL